MKNQAIWAVIAVVILGWAGTAQAGGYDTPMLYTARHQGMGGTAIAYVDDGAAFYHNPAGIAAYDKANVLLGVGMLLGHIQASPAADQLSIQSNLTAAPLPLLGGGVRLFNTNEGGENNFALTVGAGVFPVASAGGSYTYETASGATLNDATTLIFIEAAPGIGLALENTPVGDFRLGATYRITYVSLDRSRTPEGGDPTLAINPTGTNFEGFRLGFQWQPIDEVQFGVTYRHRIDTDIEQDGGVFLPFGNLDRNSTTFTLPGRLGFGLRGDYANIGLAFDLEYAFNSQNAGVALTGEAGGMSLALPNVFNWTDALTLRFGGEYNIEIAEERAIKPRLGFAFDDKTSTTFWPTAFGTPPGPTYILSLGAGYDAGPWEINFAYAYRWGTASVTPGDVQMGQDMEMCNFCGFPGDPAKDYNYAINLHGIYLDFSWDFD